MTDASTLEIEPKFVAWRNAVLAAGSIIHSVEIVKLLRKKNGQLLFALLDVDVRSPEGNKLPNYLFLRGDACLIVPQIRNLETGEEKFLMILQRRIGNGQLSLEFPAGMLDDDINDPLGVAMRELSEETGISAAPLDLFPLGDKKLYSSVGAADEAIFYFGCMLEFDNAGWRSLAGRLVENPGEDEYIAIVLKAREEALTEATSLQVRLGVYLFEEYLSGKA